MSKNLLGSKHFIDSDGLDHRTSAVLSLKKITEHFRSLGYEVLEISQKWRNVHVTLKKSGQKYFAKLASTPGISSRLVNEVAFNKQLNAVLRSRNINSFITPEIVESGTYETNHFYISEYYPEPILWNKQSGAGEVEEKLPAVVDLNLILLSINSLKLPRDGEFNKLSLGDRANRYITKWTDFYEDVKEFELAELLEILKTIRQTFQPALNHCDFTPWHLLNGENKLILIDSEHASNFNPKYYDVAYFFHRTFTVGGLEIAAKKYISLFRKSLESQALKNEFDRMIKPILAARIIGGFWDAKSDGKTDFTLHEKLKLDYLSNKIY